MSVETVQLQVGKTYTLINKNDFDYFNQWRWKLDQHGYVVRNKKINGKYKLIRLHREIAKTPQGLFTDHINGNKLDNRRENLRIVTKAQNAVNTDYKANNSSGYKGITWYKRDKKWKVRIQDKYGRNKYIKTTSSLEEAIKLRNFAVNKYFGIYGRIIK